MIDLIFWPVTVVVIAVELARAGCALVVLDSLVNSSPAVLPVLRRLTKQPIPLVTADVRDRGALKSLFSEHAIDAVVHCAGLKAVGEGEARPLTYYDNNVGGAIALVEAMAAGVPAIGCVGEAGPEAVAQKISKALSANRPSTRYAPPAPPAATAPATSIPTNAICQGPTPAAAPSAAC